MNKKPIATNQSCEIYINKDTLLLNSHKDLKKYETLELYFDTPNICKNDKHNFISLDARSYNNIYGIVECKCSYCNKYVAYITKNKNISFEDF